MTTAEIRRLNRADARDRVENAGVYAAQRAEFIRTGVMRHSAVAMRAMLIAADVLSAGLRKEVERAYRVIGPCDRPGCACEGLYTIVYPVADREAAAANYFRID